MDLDQIMSKVYKYATRDDRITEALSCYTDIINEHGDNSPEEQNMYSVASTIFPELGVLFDRVKYLKAAFAKGEIGWDVNDELLDEARKQVAERKK